MIASTFHPAVADWFGQTLGEPTEPQAQAWPAIQGGKHALIAAPTGSGKTLAAFLCAIDALVRESLEQGGLPDETRVLYISPLKALSHDIEVNLQVPVKGIEQALQRAELPPAGIQTWVRTGDTLAHHRTRAAKRPPHIVVTTPESLFILLTSESGRRMLRTVRTVILDEIHALVRDKRGSHLALSIERLEALVEGPLQRIGLSATQKPIDHVARYLLGARDAQCHIVDSGHKRALDIDLELPSSPLEGVLANEVWEELYDRLAQYVEENRTTLIFTNTRRVAERVARHLSERLGAERVTAHHGSLAREQRLKAERRLKAGELSAVVATASLELGIDIGDVDLVCQLGSPRSIATFLQRVGRSGHNLRGTPRGRLFPMSRDDLVECTALLDAVRRGELDQICIPVAPLDVLAQQIVAASATDDWSCDALFTLFRSSSPYAALERDRFDQVVRMLSEGFSTQRGRRAALVHHDAVNGRVRGRRGARLAAITSGGAIPDSFDYEVRLEPENARVGTVNEDFAIESMAGDVFQLGNTSYRIKRVEPGLVRVEDARGIPPSLPFWLGEAPARTVELSHSVVRLREKMDGWLAEGLAAAGAGLIDEYKLSSGAAEQLVDYLGGARAALGALPTQDTLVLERFFDETGSMHLVLHSPFGARINRGFGLALRKKFCRSFNVELQAAADDDAIVLSLGPMHSFALEDVMRFVRSHNVEDALSQAVLASPMFEVRWRWNASRSLAVLRFSGGKKVPPRFQRMLADDLLACAFPDQVACGENIEGDREIPDHPLVQQTMHDCLHEAMDLPGLQQLLSRLEGRDVRVLCRDLTEPSPLAQEILNARPYAFLDDAPLEERRTQAVMARRWLDPKTAGDLGALDPEAIARVVDECTPAARDRDELHDALVVHGALVEARSRSMQTWFDELVAEGRACRWIVQASESDGGGGGTVLWVPAERVDMLRLVHPDAVAEPPLQAPPGCEVGCETREQALRELVRGRLEAMGPVTASTLAQQLGVAVLDTDAALAALEAEGFVLRGRFTPGVEVEQWCERRLLSRVHRYTLGRLRSEIEPVSAAVYMRFLLRFQRVGTGDEVEGPEALYGVLHQLAGFEVSAAAWERDVLPLRVKDYDPTWLDSLCWSGRVSWLRRSRWSQSGKGAGPVKTTPITLMPRAALGGWLAVDDRPGEPKLSSQAQTLLEVLTERGALFFADLCRESRLLQDHAQRALGELVSAGLVSADGFSGLRALLTPADRRRGVRGRSAPYGMDSAGRWTALGQDHELDVEQVAWALLLRWGVVFRRLLEREGRLPPWRDLVRVYRRLEARGEIRGGRFVAGFTGEQYALSEAVGALRKMRREKPSGELVSISAADPLNLAGIVTPGERVAAVAHNRLLLRDGVPVAARVGREVSFLEDVPEQERWELTSALTKRRVAPQIRAYLGNSG